MHNIEHSNLKKGMTVYYCHPKVDAEPDGPFVVNDFYRDHEGNHVILKRKKLRGEVRRVSLAHDDDYGAPSFYTK